MQRLFRFERVFRPIAILAAVGGFAVAFYAERDGISDYPWQISWPAFIGAVLLFAFGPFAGAAVFRILLHDLTGQTPVGASTHVWMRGFIARYVPSGALTMVVRLRERERLNATTRQIWRASLVEQLVSALAGAITVTVALALASDHVPLAAPLLLGVCLAVALVVTRRPRAVVFASLVGCTAWVTSGAAAWLIVAAMTPSPPGPLWVAGAYSFAWLLGFIVVLAPSGFGIREATLIALLSPHVGLAPATLVAVTLRLANTAGDLLALGIVEIAAAGLRSRQRPTLKSSQPEPGR